MYNSEHTLFPNRQIKQHLYVKDITCQLPNRIILLPGAMDATKNKEVYSLAICNALKHSIVLVAGTLDQGAALSTPPAVSEVHLFPELGYLHVIAQSCCWDV